jgi:hypothetical protein
MVNYNNGKIYKIEAINGEEGDVYIGSTTKELLSQRMSKHRSSYNEWKKGKGHNISSYVLFEKYGVVNCKIVLIEIVNATSSDELRSRESFYIKELLCVNKKISFITKEEKRDNKNRYSKEHIEDKKEYDRLYRERNKEALIIKKQLYHENNKEKINLKQREKHLKKKLEKSNTSNEI